VVTSFASAVAGHRTDIDHFDELLVIAMLHQSESVRIEQDLRRCVDGKMTIEELRERARPSMQ
jgi:hypothetical protein